jgi:hypothetical protein
VRTRHHRVENWLDESVWFPLASNDSFLTTESPRDWTMNTTTALYGLDSYRRTVTDCSEVGRRDNQPNGLA